MSEEPAVTSVGWVGVGAMGRPMAAAVAAAGMPVTAYDANSHQLDDIEALGVAAASSPNDAVRLADVVVVMVATPAQGEEVLFGAHGIAPELAPGTVVLIMATVGFDAVTKWADLLVARGVDLVDAPVSGGVARAVTGELLTMVGGSDSAVSKVRPILSAVSRSVTVVGPKAGDGQRMKLVNQLLCGVHIAAAAEALGFAEALGLEASAAWEVVRLGAAASFMLEDRGRRMVDGTFDDVRSAVNLFVKDMGLVGAAGRAVAYPTPLASAAEHLYLSAREAGLGDLDDSSVIEVARGTITNSRSAPDASRAATGH